MTSDNGWQHITWPFLSQTDADRAYEKFESNVTKVQTEDRANTLWFIAAMDQLGYRTTDYVVTGNIQGSVYYNDDTGKYTAEVWNPTETTQRVTIKDQSGKTMGTANIGSRGLVSFNIDTEETFALTQVATPTMKATSRWQAEANDDEWIQIDLGSVQAVNTVMINWEAAYAAKYQIQVSTDGEKWTTVAEENGLAGEITSTFAATKARYVRMQGVSRGTQYGYSIYEFEVYGALQAKAPTITPVSGTYDEAQTVTLSTAAKGAEIKYTLDGSEPTEDSPTYTAPIIVSKSTIVKAVTYRKGMLLSDTTEANIIIAGTMSLNKTEARIAIGRTVQLSAMTDMTVTWESNNTGVATVDENGLVKGVSVGEATITVKASNGQQETCKITVTEPIHITSVEMKPATLEMKNKTSQTLEVIINPADTTDDTTVTWSSSDESLLVVKDNGTITAKGEGVVTVTAKVGNFTATCEVTIGPAATVAEMAASSKYNVALKKTVTANPSKGEGDVSLVTDGALTGGHAATKFGTAGTYYEIDLGNTYDASGIDQIVSVYKEENDSDTPVKGYEIQYSTNGIDFTTVKIVNGAEAKEAWIANELIDVQEVSATGAVRYVRLYYPDSYGYGIQVREIAVLSTEQNINKVEVEKCEAPAGVTVTSDAYCELTYTIDAGQDGYKYIVYLDGNKIEELIDAGTYTVTELDAGTHTIEVISYYDKKISDVVAKEVYVDDGSLKNYVGTARNLSLGATVTVEAIESEHEEGSKDTATLVDGVISQDNAKVVQTVWGTETATIVMDLGKELNKEEIYEVLLAFKAENTMATAYTIEFSANGSDYEQVMDVTNAKYKETFEHEFDPTTYSAHTVRYVRINLTDGNVNWGYQISEIAIMGGEEYMPVEPEGLVAESPSYNTRGKVVMHTHPLARKVPQAALCYNSNHGHKSGAYFL